MGFYHLKLNISQLSATIIVINNPQQKTTRVNKKEEEGGGKNGKGETEDVDG